MNLNYTIYSVFFLATSMVSFFVAFLAWQRLSVKGARELTRLMIAAGIWSFWLIFETAAPTKSEKLFWSGLEYIGAVTAPVFYLIFILRFTDKDKFLSTRNILMLFIIPMITLALAMTNEKHLLVWSGFSAISAQTNMMEYYHGIWFWIGYMSYNYILFLLATIYLFSFIFKQNKTFRSQGLFVLIAGLCPWTASVIYITGINPWPGLDITPVSIILSGTILVIAILYTRFLDLVPVARETLVETLPDGILALDGQNRIQDINEAAISFLGISNKNIIGLPAESSGASVRLLMNAAIDEKSIEQIEIQTSNEVKTFRIIKKTINNQPGSRLVIINDMTERSRMESEKAALESQNRQLQKTESLTRMAAAIAHLFNNQLGVVIGYLEMAINELPKGSSHAIILTAAIQSAWNASNISGSMLTYLGQSLDKVEPLDLSDSCRKILLVLKAAIPENVILETNYSSPGTLISTNPNYMQLVLTNLINNAWEAVGNNSGTISLNVKTVPSAEISTTQRFPIDWQTEDNLYACLEVADTGSGIEDKDIEKIFDPFFSTKFTGRGMGLALVLGIVKTHKGVLTVESEPGRGSTFRVFFPLAKEALQQPQKDASSDDSLISTVCPIKFE